MAGRPSGRERLLLAVFIIGLVVTIAWGGFKVLDAVWKMLTP